MVVHHRRVVESNGNKTEQHVQSAKVEELSTTESIPESHGVSR